MHKIIPLLGTSADARKVFPRQDTDAEHIHCNLETLAEALSKITVGTASFSRYTVSLDHVVGTDRCVKIEEGDKIVMWNRPGRGGATPMFVSAKEPVETNKVNVVLCYDDEQLHEYVVITAFTGIDAPQEPWDPRVGDIEYSTKFWSEYALVPSDDELAAMKQEGIV